MRAGGHDVVKIPMYLPLFAHEAIHEDVPVFYGAVSLYLKQMIPAFRKMPDKIMRVFDSAPMLKLAAEMSGSTDAKGLEALTISMLEGENGQQADELDRMVSWLEEHHKPDVIHISNALLLGLVRTIKTRLKVPVVCSLQDEDVWVDAMDCEYADKVWQLMAERGADVDAFVAVSDYFAQKMKTKLLISSEKLHVVHLGIDSDNYHHRRLNRGLKNVGYISRMCVENGFDMVIDAFILLKQNPEMEIVKLIVTGGSTKADKKFIKQQINKISEANLLHSVEFISDFETEGRKVFFDKVSLISVPVRGGEAFGLYLLEAMASGVAVVQPDEGAFGEIIAKAGGGMVYSPNSSEALCSAWTEILLDNSRLSVYQEAAIVGVHEKFEVKDKVREMVSIYKKLIC